MNDLNENDISKIKEVATALAFAGGVAVFIARYYTLRTHCTLIQYLVQYIPVSLSGKGGDLWMI